LSARTGRARVALETRNLPAPAAPADVPAPASAARVARLLAALAAAAALGSCATASGDLPPIPMIPVPQAGTLSGLPPYKVQVGDVLDVKLYLNPELNDQVTVRPDGKFSTSIAQDVPAYNHTPAQIAAELRHDYAGTLKNPHVNVIVHSFAPDKIYVGGEVNDPGEYITVGPNLTISQAIARAGGVKLSGDRARIFVIRRGPHDKAEAFSVDYKDIISGRHPEDDVRLAPYDVVYVPRTGIYEVWTFWNQFVQQFVPVNWGFSYSVNPSVTTGK
jgi:protein involved in polysaccharide export with SLBB domain